MLVRCWGARGSIPVSGREYLRFGGDTACVEVRGEDDRVIVLDAGSGIRGLGNQLLAEGKREVHLLFTHAHWDHLLGFPFFKPLYRRSSVIRIYGCSCAQASIRRMISDTMAPPNFPVPLEDVRSDVSFHEDCRDPFAIGRLSVVPILLSHPDRGLGYRIAEGRRSFVFLTDNELSYRHPESRSFEDYVEFCRRADLVFHDAEFTDADYRHTRGWGHSTFGDAVRLALAAGVKALGLFHHNPDRTDEQLGALAASARELVDDNGAALDCFAVAQGMECRL